MRKWAFLLAATAAVVIGCGGSSGGGGSTTTSGSTSGRATAATVNLPQTDGIVTFGFLTGQGRDTNPLVAVITRLYLQNADFGLINRTQSSQEVPLALDSYGAVQQIPLVAQFQGNATYLNSGLFETFNFDPNSFRPDGTTSTDTVLRDSTIPFAIPSAIRAFPGRQSFVPIHLDATMFSIDANNVVTMDQAKFNNVNFGPSGGVLQSRLSDFVRFDLTGLDASARPLMSDGTTAASYVYFSGDNYSLSDADPRGIFETLTLDPTSPVVGHVAPPSTGTTKFPGTYNNQTTSPADVFGVAKLTAVVGTWRDYKEVLSNIHTFEVVMFPNSSEKYDATKQGDLVAIVRNASGVITNFYFGAANLDAGTFKLFPIKNLVGGDTTGELDGTLTAYLNRSGGSASLNDLTTVRNGTYTFTTPAAQLPTGFLATGSFVVFRR